MCCVVNPLIKGVVRARHTPGPVLISSSLVFWGGYYGFFTCRWGGHGKVGVLGQRPGQLAWGRYSIGQQLFTNMKHFNI